VTPPLENHGARWPAHRELACRHGALASGAASRRQIEIFLRKGRPPGESIIPTPPTPEYLKWISTRAASWAATVTRDAWSARVP
jgi:hypothetical protein